MRRGVDGEETDCEDEQEQEDVAGGALRGDASRVGGIPWRKAGKTGCVAPEETPKITLL